jgi:hypothetical protein
MKKQHGAEQREQSIVDIHCECWAVDAQVKWSLVLTKKFRVNPK